MNEFTFLFDFPFGALFRLLRISKIFSFFALIMGALIWYRGKTCLMYIAVWESQSPSPLALQKCLFFAVLCVRYVALRSGSVSQTTMLLRLSRPYSYDPRPISKKPKKSRNSNQPSCLFKMQKRNRNTIQNLTIWRIEILLFCEDDDAIRWCVL